MKNTLLFFLAIAFLVSCGKKTSNTTADNATTITHSNNGTTDAAPNPMPAANTLALTGTYADVPANAKGGREEGYQELKVWGQEGNKIKFELMVQHGGPGYHSGFIDGEIEVKNNVAAMETTEYSGKCKIVFTFAGNEVAVEQVEGGDTDCGFGAGVMAGGKLMKQSSEKPISDEK